MTEDNNKTYHSNENYDDGDDNKICITYNGYRIPSRLEIAFWIALVMCFLTFTCLFVYNITKSIAIDTTDKHYMYIVTNDKQIIQLPREASLPYKDKFYRSFKNAMLVYYMGENVYCYYNSDNYTQKDRKTKDHDIIHEYNCIVSHTI